MSFATVKQNTPNADTPDGVSGPTRPTARVVLSSRIVRVDPVEYIGIDTSCHCGKSDREKYCMNK